MVDYAECAQTEDTVCARLHDLVSRLDRADSTLAKISYGITGDGGVEPSVANDESTGGAIGLLRSCLLLAGRIEGKASFIDLNFGQP